MVFRLAVATNKAQTRQPEVFMKIEGGPFSSASPEPLCQPSPSCTTKRDEAFVLVGERRIDCVPDLLIDQQVRTRYRLEVTEHQLLYLYDLVSVDEGENASALSSKHFEELVSMLCYHKQGIDGPPSGGM